MSRPLFLILTYNQERYIGQAVEAALAQTGVALDILVSDDCSPDGTFDAIEAAMEGYVGPHTVRVNRNPENLGLIGHVNSLLERVENEYIILAAGDDISMPGRSKAIMAAFETEDCDLVHSNVEEIGVDGTNLDVAPMRALFHRTTDLDRSAVGLGLYVGATGAIHRSLLDRFGPLPAGTYEDLIFGFRAVLGRGAYHISEPLVQYRAGIGISADVATPTVNEWRVERTRTLTRHMRVMEARLADAATAGLAPDHRVMKRMQQKRANFEARVKVLGQGVGFAVKTAFRGNRHALPAWWSERKRERIAMREG